MGQTPIYDLPYPEPTDPADGPGGFEALATATEGVFAGLVAPVMTKIADLTKSSPGPSFDFQAIPQTFRDLLLAMDFRGDAAGPMYVNVVCNNTPGGAAYSRNFVQMSGAYSGQFLTNQGSGDIATGGGTDMHPGAFAPVRIVFPEYRAARPQMWLSDGMTPGGHTMTKIAGMWGGTAAITALTFASNMNFVAGSRATLYGVS